jgi:FtsH-binding integral membrane protein
MIVGPVTNFASPLQRDIYLVVVIAIVIFSGAFTSRRGAQDAMPGAAILIVIVALVLGVVLAFIH